MVQWMMGDWVDGSVWATGWDSRRNTGPGIGLGLAQPPEPASDTEHASRHTHSHCLDTADTGHLDRHSTCVKTTQTQQTQRGIHVCIYIHTYTYIEFTLITYNVYCIYTIYNIHAHSLLMYQCN